MTFFIRMPVKAKHDPKRKSITSTILKVKIQIADSFQFTALYFAHLKAVIYYQLSISVDQRT